MSIPFTIASLKSELSLDPLALGYAGPYSRGEDGTVVDLFNQVRSGITVRRTNIMPSELLQAIDTRDFQTNWTEGEKVYLNAALNNRNPLRFIDDDGTFTSVYSNIRRTLNSLDTFGSRVRLSNSANTSGSRAEQIWGTDFRVTVQNIIDSRA